MEINLTLILEVITFFILLFLLNKFVFRGLVKMLDERKQHIEKNLKDIKQLREEASGDREKTKELLLEAKKTALSIKEEAFAYSEKFKEQKAKEAEKEAQEIREKAQEELSLYLNKVKEELKRYSGELSFQIAAKILAQEIDKNKHKDLVEESLKDLYEQRSDYF